MVSAATLAKQPRPVRMMLVGYPKAGKTGALACLANAGFKLRILDYDGNTDPLFAFTDPKALANIEIVTLEDKLRKGPKHALVTPTAFVEGWEMLDHWRYKDPETGEVIDLGRSRDWGPDTIVVLDSLTGMGRASMRRTLHMLNRTPLNRRRQDWGLAMEEQENLIERLVSPSNRHHVLVTAHLKMVGPKDIEKDDEDLTVQLKKRAADIVPTRLFPSALGRELPQHIGEHFPALVLAEAKAKGREVRRVLSAIPRPELDLGVSAKDLPKDLGIEDGLLTMFDILTGGVQRCLTTTPTS